MNIMIVNDANKRELVLEVNINFPDVLPTSYNSDIKLRKLPAVDISYPAKAYEDDVIFICAVLQTNVK